MYDCKLDNLVGEETYHYTFHIFLALSDLVSVGGVHTAAGVAADTVVHAAECLVLSSWRSSAFAAITSSNFTVSKATVAAVSAATTGAATVSKRVLSPKDANYLTSSIVCGSRGITIF